MGASRAPSGVDDREESAEGAPAACCMNGKPAARGPFFAAGRLWTPASAVTTTPVMKMQAVSRFTTRPFLLGQGTSRLANWRQVTWVPYRLSSKRSAPDYYAGQSK